MTTIQVRTDKKIKKNAQQVLKDLGMDLSTAINIYLMKIIATKGIPFLIVTENGFTPAAEAKMLKETAWAEKHGKRFSSVEAMMKDILDE